MTNDKRTLIVSNVCDVSEYTSTWHATLYIR